MTVAISFIPPIFTDEYDGYKMRTLVNELERTLAELTRGVDVIDITDNEINDLSVAVTWANVPDANITQSSVVQHEGALTILESQITDANILARIAGNETITGAYTFKNVAGIVIQDAGGTDSVKQSHDGTDFTFDFTNTALARIKGADLSIDQNIIIDAAQIIKWLDAAAVAKDMLVFKLGTGIGAEVGHATHYENAQQTTTSGTYVDFTNAKIDQADLDNGATYLVYVTATMWNATSNATAANAVRLTYNNLEIGNSEQLWEGKIGLDNTYGHQYSFCGTFVAGAAGDLQIEYKSGNGSDTIKIANAQLMVIKIGDLGTDLVTSTSTSVVELDDGNFPPTAAFDLGVSITIGDGVSDYLILGCAAVGDFLSGGNTVTIDMLSNGGSNKTVGVYQRADNSDEKPMGIVGYYAAPAASTAITLTGIGTGFPVDKKYAFLCAIRMNAFAEFFSTYVATGPVLAGFPGDTAIAVIAKTATVSSSNWCLLGSTTHDFTASGTSGADHIRLDINGGGDNNIAGDTIWRIQENGTSHTLARFMVSVDQTINATETIDADLMHEHAVNPPEGIIETILIAFTWDLSGAADAFSVGHSSFITNYLGDKHRFFGGDGVDYFEFDVDGTDLNLTGFQIADINLTGITNLKMGTVDLDADDITATSYGGILEDNLVSKIATATISAVWDFTTNPKIDAAGIDTGTFADARIAESNVTQHEAALTILEAQITDGTLLARLAANEIIVGDWEHQGLLITAAGTEGAPSLHFTSDSDTGIYSPAANAWAVTVGGTEAVRYTGASAPLIRYGMTTGITASTTQTQGQQPLPGSYNEIGVCANNNDVVTLPPTASGEMCIVINNGAKRLQVFPASGQDLGLGVNQPDLIKAGASVFFVSFDSSTWFDIASKISGLLDTDVIGIVANDLLYYDGTNYKHTGGNLTWDASLFDITGDLQVSGKSGFYGAAAIAQQTGVAVTAAGVHAALVNLGLITA